MTRRHLPRWSELAPLIRFAGAASGTRDRRLARSASIADLRSLAMRKSPRAVFDYVDGGADDEMALQRSRAAFERAELVPRVLRDVSTVDTSTSFLGTRSELPLAFAPTGFTRLMHHEGESAVARIAQRTGIPYALSTMGTTSIERLADAAPDARKWFQLYLWRDRDSSREMVRQAADAGYEALMLTVDTPVAGARLRDVRNGFTIPPTLTLKTFLGVLRHPAWWFNLLTTEPLSFASLNSWEGTVAELVNRVFDASVTLDDFSWLRDIWPGSLIVKGIMTVEDAVAVIDRGADAVVVSNHGGRQLGRAPTPLEQLPTIVSAVDGRAEVYVDGGIMSGADVVVAIACGARGCLIGRAYLYGLMAGGERGVQHAADILRRDIIRTMQLLGVGTLDELTRDHVRLRSTPRDA